jgi:glycosyltransferase involved in cell wall biosynthesis
MPPEHQRRLLQQQVLQPSRRLKARNNTLTPFRYVLFNSSVEPRKNLLFVIRAYRQSGLSELGIRLCVTGQLKQDDYSRAVAEQSDESVLLTGYIDEQTKASLFLHTLLVLSPSLVEGFGIPVLDAACVGAPAIASPSASHGEIQSLHDFESLVWLCDTRDPLDWAIAMKDLAAATLTTISSPDVERQRRLDRYDQLHAVVFERFRETLCANILKSFKSEMADDAVHD